MRLLSEGTHASVYAVRGPPRTGAARVVACKVVDASQAIRAPHDVHVEIAVLAEVRHGNVVELLDWEHGERGPTSAFKLYLPLLAITLSELLQDPHFAPTCPPEDFLLEDGARVDPLEGLSDRAQAYHAIAASLLQQTARGLAHLHATGVAHRDVKPSNVMLDWDGTVRIIDLGVAWREGRDLPCAVGSGSYRAPELLFGEHPYDPFALDKWALGCLFAQFYTPLALVGATAEEGAAIDADSLESPDVLGGFTVVDSLSDSDSDDSCTPPSSGDRMNRRQTLFDSSRGDVGLIWSIMRLRGKPTTATWPEFAQLPDSDKVEFRDTPGVALDRVLPHLPDKAEDRSFVLRSLEGLLAWSPARRPALEDLAGAPPLQAIVDRSTDWHSALLRFIPPGPPMSP